jgi:hypothetical protein
LGPIDNRIGCVARFVLPNAARIAGTDSRDATDTSINRNRLTIVTGGNSTKREIADVNMKALVTGGAGFIGSHLAERMLNDGDEVTILDDLSTGRLENLQGFRHRAKLQFVKGDIRDSTLVQLLASQCDVVHLAAAVGVQLIADDPVHHRDEHRRHGGRVEAANKFRKILLTSSEIYGKSEKVPCRG